MRRREFIKAIAGPAVAWPFAAQAQQVGRMRRLGVMKSAGEHDAESLPRKAALEEALQKLGWAVGRNLQIDYRWANGDVAKMPGIARELVELAPDVILAPSNPCLAALQPTTKTIPIVFVSVADPVASGFVASLARPGGNVTGFTHFEPEIGGKWLETLLEIAPGIKRAVGLLHAGTPANVTMFRGAEAASSSRGVTTTAANAQEPSEIERAIVALAAESDGALIILPHVVTARHRALIIELAARHRLPAIYPFRYFVLDGGLMSYGADQIDHYRRAAPYIDRILKGEKPENLPVQASTKFDLAINLKTAKALGLIVPPSLLGRADEVIE
jgi:putative tryptophan/tyrosine transport system substrate-binding protein